MKTGQPLQQQQLEKPEQLIEQVQHQQQKPLAPLRQQELEQLATIDFQSLPPPAVPLPTGHSFSFVDACSTAAANDACTAPAAVASPDAECKVETGAHKVCTTKAAAAVVVTRGAACKVETGAHHHACTTAAAVNGCQEPSQMLADGQSSSSEESASSSASSAAVSAAAAGCSSNSSGTVIGSYRLGSTLGVGTFGKVKLGYHLVTGEEVAVKIINKAKMDAMEMHEKVRREIQILQCLTHPHVIRLYELIDTPTDIFLAMEYMQGGELFDYIVEKSRVPENEARRFFQQIVSGVAYCHRHLVCHRDLKPENVLLDSSMNVKIGDFGLSHFMRDGDFLKTSCGSPNYASPEVVSGKAYAGTEVDVWSLGVVLYALLCGALPFDDEHVPNLFKRIRHGNFLLPGHLSEGSRDLIVKMLVVDPSKRISLKEIQQHPWFTQALPPYLSSNHIDMPLFTHLDPFIIKQLKQLGYHVNERQFDLKQKVGGFPSREAVAYQLLASRRLKQSSFANMLELSSKNEPHVFSLDQRKRVAALFENPPSHSPDPPETMPAALANRGANFNINSSSQNTAVVAGATTTTSATPPPTRWRLGVEAAFDAPILITAIVNTLKACDYEWQLLSPYTVRCRPVHRSMTDNNNSNSKSRDLSAAAGNREEEEAREQWGPLDLILTVQLYKITANRYIVDVQLFDGATLTSISEALWVISAVYSALTQLQQQQQQRFKTTASTSSGASSNISSIILQQGFAAFCPTTPVLLHSPPSAIDPRSE